MDDQQKTKTLLRLSSHYLWLKDNLQVGSWKTDGFPPHATKAKINKRVAQLQQLATSCSKREVAILACAVEELFVEHDIDAMQQIVVIQVDAQFNSWHTTYYDPWHFLFR